MKPIYILLLLPLLPACQQERVVHDSTISRQFAQMNKDGWAVTSASDPQRTTPSADPNVRVIHEADFSGYHFNTNFQIDDPRFPKPNQPALSTPSTSPAGAPPGAVPDPWLTMPVAPLPPAAGN